MRPKRRAVAAFTVSFLTLVSVQSAYAGISSVGAGLSIASPVGIVYQTIPKTTGFQMDLFFDAPDMIGQNLQLRLTGNYHAHAITNLTDGRLGMAGIFAGVQTSRRNDAVKPFFGLDLGGMIDWLQLQGGATTSNIGFAFSTRVLTGIDIPVGDSFGAALEMPVTFSFFRPTLTTWNAVFSLRWKL
jgi:hypothetical protein